MAARVYAKPSPREILLNLIRHADSRSSIYGGVIRDMLDTNKMPSDLRSDIDVVISRMGYERFLEATQLGGFLREVKEKPMGVAPHRGGRYSHHDESPIVTYNVLLEIGSTEFELDLNVGKQNTCDFTCNNLMQSPDNPNAITTRCADPMGTTGLPWITRCIRDIAERVLVPMCPVEVLSLNERSSQGDRCKTVNLIRRAMKRMQEGYTLKSHLSGAALTFEVYQPIPSNQPQEDHSEGSVDLEKCSICQEVMDKPLTSVVLLCGHPLHIDCLLSLVHTEGTPSSRCPICRKVVMFTNVEGKTHKEIVSGSKKVPASGKEKPSDHLSPATSRRRRGRGRGGRMVP